MGAKRTPIWLKGTSLISRFRVAMRSGIVWPLAATIAVALSFLAWKYPAIYPRPDICLGVDLVLLSVVGVVVSAHGPSHTAWKLSYAVVCIVLGIVGMRLVIQQSDATAKADQSFQSKLAEVSKTTQEISRLTGLNTQLQQNLVHQSNTIMGLSVDAIKTQTGGDSFAYITFTEEPPMPFEFHIQHFLAPRNVPFFVVSVTSQGKYPLRGIQAVLMDDERRTAAMQEYNKQPTGDFASALFSADINYQMPYLRPVSAEAPNGQVDVIGLYPMPSVNSKKITVNFAASNGYWNEVLHLGRVGGKWHQCLSVLGPTVEQSKRPFVHCDSEWEEGKKQAEQDWIFNPPKTGRKVK